MLVLRALGLGDLLTGVPALRSIRAAWPEHRLVLAAPAALRELAALTGAIDEVLPVGELEPLPRLPAPPEVAVNLHGRGPQSTQSLLATRPARLIAFAHADVPETAGFPTWRADEHEVSRWCRLLAESGIPADPADLVLPAPPVAPPPGATGAVIVHPGAKSCSRRWPADRFAAVAAALSADGHRVVITGTAAEGELARSVAAAAGLDHSAVLAGRTDLLGLAAIVASAQAVVCGDTGMGHLATAYGVPSVLLFGPTPPARWGPPPQRRQHRVLWHGHAGDPLGDAPEAGILRVTVAEVRTALADVLHQA